MSAFKIAHKITGLKELNRKMIDLKKSMLAGQVDAVRESVFLIHATAVNSIQDNSSGRPQVRYSGSGKKRTVLASHPGDPPNTDTGRLVQSIKFDFKDSGLTGRVGTNLRYGAFLEFGTSDMEARPWLSRAVMDTARVVAQIFAKYVNRSAKEVAK